MCVQKGQTSFSSLDKLTRQGSKSWLAQACAVLDVCWTCVYMWSANQPQSSNKAAHYPLQHTYKGRSMHSACKHPSSAGHGHGGGGKNTAGIQTAIHTQHSSSRCVRLVSGLCQA